MLSQVTQIDSSLITGSLQPLGALILFAVVVGYFKPLQDPDYGNSTINIIKCVLYGLLAGYIFVQVSNSNSKTIDVLTVFTYALASLESIHCFYNAICIKAGPILRAFFKNEAV